jgi:protein TonB
MMVSEQATFPKGAQAAHWFRDEISLYSITLSAIWLVCMIVGGLGLILPYTRVKATAPLPPPVQAEILNVELTTQPLAPPENQPPLKLSKPPPLIQPVTVPSAPPLIAVAEPSPAIAFALPVEGPVHVVEAKQPAYVQTTAPTNSVALPVVQTLVFGQGEGKQPAPEYPRQAIRQGQEGKITVRFVVGETGQVTDAEVATRSPWALLNEAALRTVRNRWRFRAGNTRVYEVQIRFELGK